MWPCFATRPWQRRVTTVHDASETGLSISGIFQAADDFAVLCMYNAYDYFNHLRLKHLPRTDLSGLKLEFDIEYDHDLDGAMRFDAAKSPSVSWDALTFVTGVGDLHDVRLLDHATVVSGGETPAACQFAAVGNAPSYGSDYLHVYFRDTRYTVAHTDCIVETQLTASVLAHLTAQTIQVANTAGIQPGDYVYIERTGTNQELTQVVAVGVGTLDCVVTVDHPAGSYVTLWVGAKHMLQRLAAIVNQGGDPVVGRFGPDQSATIQASVTAFSQGAAVLRLRFITPALPGVRYGKLGNLDRILVTSGHVDAAAPDPPGSQQINWTDGSGASQQFSGGDDNTKYHVTLDFRQELRDKTNAVVPMNDCRKIYMVFAPRLKGPADVDVEWRATISNITLTGDGALRVGGNAERIEERDGRCTYTGYWEDYAYNAGWPTRWWSEGHARRCAPAFAGDVRKVTIRYSRTGTHDLYLGTFLNTNCGKISVSVDGGAATTHDLYLNEYGGTTANIRLRQGVAAGNHTVEITALFEKNAASSGYYFYFDHLWPLVPQDAPDAPEQCPNVSLAIDFDTDHGYRKPPAWHLWHLQRLGFRGHADVYMGVFWNNKRRRVGASYPFATVEFSGDPVPGDVVSITISGTPVNHAIGYGETLQDIVSQMRAAINGMFVGVWADDNFGSSTTLRIQSKAPSWTFPGIAVSVPNSVTLTLTDNLGTAGTEGDWELIDAVTPVMTEGARKWIRDLASQFQAAGILASFAFSMEVYNPPAAMRAKYLRYVGGVVSPGEDVYLDVPSHQMHFGPRVRNYLKQMYKECADEIAAAGLAVILQFGETQWWYFDNRGQDPNGGMGFYDQGTIDEFQAAKGHQIWPFTANTDDPDGDPAHPQETADFLRDRIWQYCRDVISHVRSYHPAALLECLWPLDANQGKPAPDPAFRRLLMHVNLPNEWKNSSYGIKYFRAEGFDYDVWQKNAVRMRQTLTYPNEVLGRPPEECIYLSGIYGPPDPPIAQAYGLWRAAKLYSMCFWAFDQFCLNSRPVPLEMWVQAKATAAAYHKPRIARALDRPSAVDVVAPAGGALNRFQLNERKCNE